MPAAVSANHSTTQRQDRQDGVSQALLAAIVESSGDAIIGKDLDGVVTSWNAGAEEAYGYTAAEMIGQPISRLLPSDRSGELPAIMERVRRGVRIEPFETERVCKDGRRIHVSLSVSPVRGPDGAVVGASAIARDITERRWAEALVICEREVLELVARGRSLKAALEALARRIEELAGEGLLASILLVDEDGAHLRHGAAPSLPAAYNRAIDGAPIGPSAGSCGTAVYLRKPVVVTDIASDPLWDDYRHLALPHGLRACWSTPIIASGEQVMGTFALYYREPRAPNAAHLRLAAMVSRTASIVIGRAQVEASRSRLEAEREQLLAQERRAREAAERSERLLVVQNALGQVLADLSLNEAPPRILQTVCDGLDWTCGAFWEVDQSGGALRCVAVWPGQAGSRESIDEFAEVSRRSVLGPGQGLPGRVWASGGAQWVPDLSRDDSFVRAAAAAQAGLRAELAFPIRSGGRVVGVVECFGPTVRPPEEDALATAGTLGSQIGQFIERRRADEALRESEARFRELFESAPVGYQELDAQGCFTRVNQALCDLLGYSREELLGRPIWEFNWAHDEPAEETRRKFFDKLSRAEPWHAVERVRVRKDGTLRTVWVEDQLVRDAAGRVVGLRSAQLDISERKRTEEERERSFVAEREARADAEAAVAARDAMTATVTHDLKNPLAGITGWVQLLRRRAARGNTIPNDELLQSLSTIEATAKRMAALLDDLLDSARMQAGRPLDLQRRSTDLVALARQVVQESQQSTDKHSLRVAAAAPSLVGTWDGSRLERVLSNLLSNAIKYSPRGDEITVEVYACEREAVLVVCDRGLGIPAADLPHVFDRFRRASNVAGQIAGTGLGLAGAREIVALHGGGVTVESREGAGTSVTVRLPLDGTPSG